MALSLEKYFVHLYFSPNPPHKKREIARCIWGIFYKLSTQKIDRFLNKIYNYEVKFGMKIRALSRIWHEKHSFFKDLIWKAFSNTKKEMYTEKFFVNCLTQKVDGFLNKVL